MAADIIQINTQDLSTQLYDSMDVNLISSFDIDTSLTSNDTIELYIYDINNNLLLSEYNFTQYSIYNNGQSSGTNNSLSQITIDPENILINRGYDVGEYITYFNFLNKRIGSNLEPLYISEISSDRTEIRLDSVVLDNQSLIDQTTQFVIDRENSPYFLDFYLNFGDNNLLIANNIALDTQDPNNPTVLIKLYEPLPSEFTLNSPTWVSSAIDEPLAYRVSFTNEPIIIDDTLQIGGPNFNIDIKDQINNSTLELSYTDLINTSLTSSQNQINSLLEEKEIDINIDYTNFEDYIHFSSAQTRLENFYYKVGLIEQYSSSIALLNSTVSSSLNISESQAVLQNKINDIITNFDGWDYYLYYSTGSWSWPKTTSSPPYQLASTGSAAVINWFGNTNEYSPQYGGIILSASLYDENNKDNLLFSIPEYLREDPDNEPYELFIDMVAQHFDNIWIYYKDVTQKYNTDNRLEYGISKDIVADAIRDFGIKLYQNNFSNQDLYTAFLGLTPQGGLFPFPEITGSLPTPTGFEYVDTLISASNDYIPLDDVNKSLYKRIYHNIPYLLKSKGTLPGLRALITSYGIPDTILRISEYGGKDKVDSNDWDYWQNEYNFAFATAADNFISSSWDLNPDWNSPDNVPSTLMFRFKTNGLPHTNIPYSQSLWYGDGGSSITLTYTGSAYSSGSYSGSIIDPYYQYATLTFYPDITEPSTSSAVYLPFFDGGWWSVMVTRSGSYFTLHSQNKLYEGGDNGTILGFNQSSSTYGDTTPWINSAISYFPVSFSVGAPFGYDVVTYDNTAIYDGTGSFVGSFAPISGAYQEIRYYSSIISESVFTDYTMNPYSIEGNSLNTSANELAFRANIGGELYTGSYSTHPKVTGSWSTTHSFASDSSFYYDSTPNFIANREYFFYDQPIAGIKNAVSDKIRLEDNSLPSGSTLSFYRKISQTTEASSSYTSNTNLLEVAFSPQNEINDDINSSLGYFNIGEFIGDPSQRFSGNSYPDLDKLRNDYFQKYTKNYNLTDFVRLIKFFDNSLFKMIKDFIPARTSLASGIVIKQHLLERNKYPQPQMSYSDLDISGTLKPQWNDYNDGTVENFGGGTGGSFESFNYVANVSQSWTESIQTPLGIALTFHNSQDEFYNGEFSGSAITVTTQSLHQPYPTNDTPMLYVPVFFRSTAFGNSIQSSYASGILTNPKTSPNPGEILISVKRRSVGGGSPPQMSVDYIKIAKIDNNGNDQTNVLENLSTLSIKFSDQSSYFKYTISNKSEHSSYYLFETQVNPSTYYTGTNNYTLDYSVSASKSTTQTITGTIAQTHVGFGWSTVSGNTLGYFNGFGYYLLGNTPNTRLAFTASINTTGTAHPSATADFGIRLYRDGGYSDIALKSFNILFGGITTISGSLDGFDNDQVDLYIRPSNVSQTININSAVIAITQSIAPTASIVDEILADPYIETPNFYNSDYNAIINNVSENRKSNFYQDVDYTQGSLTPVNFTQLINFDATKAAVQDSNYSTLRHIIPRYLGSKSTSQVLNKWTNGDEGTYGKIPTAESLKTAVAYCDWIGGWPPERQDASGAHVKYFIHSDGTVSIPNTTDTSLYTNQNAFVSGERLIITSGDNGSQATPYRNIIRGATRIEPILYTQIGHSPANWTSSISLTTDFISSTASIGDYTALAAPSVEPSWFPDASWGLALMDNVINIGLGGATMASSKYTITQATIDENVELEFSSTFPQVYIANTALGGQTHYLSLRLIHDRSGNKTILDTNTISKYYSGPVPGNDVIGSLHVYSYLSPQDMIAGDQIYVEVLHQTSTYGTIPGQDAYYNKNARFSVSQIPSPTNVEISSSGTNTIWGYPDTTKSYVITGSNSVLNSLYDKGFKQNNISGSGFNSVVLPWSLKVGDEFRFEGTEQSTFMIKKVYSPSELDSNRISDTGSIEVHFNQNLSTSSINLDHFVIRRYVDDASLILFEGFAPTNSTGPYIIKPEYVVPELNKSLDEFVLDLTQKGLL